MRNLGRGLPRWACAAIVVPAALAASTAQASAAKLSVGSPPTLAGPGFALAIKGATGTVALYLSPGRKLTRAAVSLGRARVRHGKVRLSISASVPAGVYYVLVCVGGGHKRHCVASSRRTLILHGVQTGPKPGLPGTGTIIGVPGPGGERPTLGEGTTLSEGVALPAPEAAVSQAVGPGEGIITATGPNGTKYTLAYDAKALVPGTQVTLVPLSGMSGVAGSFAGGVLVEPEGLTFLHNAFLLVTPTGAIPARERETVGFSGIGKAIHGVPFIPQESPIALPVGTGGGYALFRDRSGETAANRPAARSGGAVVQRLAPAAAGPGPDGPIFSGAMSSAEGRAVAEGKLEEFSEGKGKAYEEAAASSQEWYESIVNNLVPPGLESDEAGEVAIRELASWATNGVAVLGDGKTVVIVETVVTKREYSGMQKLYGPTWQQDKVDSIIRQILGHAYDRVQEKCREGPDFSLIPKIIQRAHEAELAGNPEPTWEELSSCEDVQFVLQSKMDDELLGVEGGATGFLHNRYQVVVEAKPSEKPGYALEGKGLFSGDGRYLEATGTASLKISCNEKTITNEATELSGTGAAARVWKITFPGGYEQAAGPPRVVVSIGVPSENVEYKDVPSDCTGKPVKETRAEIFWYADWATEHKEDISKETGIPEVAYSFGLEGGSGEILGTKTFEDVPFHKHNAEGIENTTLKVKLSPGTYATM